MTPQEAIIHIRKHNEAHARKERFAAHITDALGVAVEALEKRIPQKPLHVHEVYPKHDWELDEDGEIDTWAMENGNHNGPVCRRCYHTPCVLCEPNWEEGECVVDKNCCPSCNKPAVRHTEFCFNCGQALDWGNEDG